MVETKARLQTEKRKLEKDISTQRRLYVRAANAHTNFIKKYGVTARGMKEFDRLQNSVIREGGKLNRLVDKLRVVDDKLDEINRLGHLR